MSVSAIGAAGSSGPQWPARPAPARSRSTADAVPAQRPVDDSPAGVARVALPPALSPLSIQVNIRPNGLQHITITDSRTGQVYVDMPPDHVVAFIDAVLHQSKLRGSDDAA